MNKQTETKKMEKVIRNGNVAVLVSPGFGAGWYSWNSDHMELLFHPKLVSMVEQNRKKEITPEWVEKELGLPNIYCGGAGAIEIIWVPVGTKFLIDEYDGSEMIIIVDEVAIIAE